MNEKIEILSVPSWLTASYNQSEKKINITIKEQNTDGDRSGQIKIKRGNSISTYEIIQEGQYQPLVLSDGVAEFTDGIMTMRKTSAPLPTVYYDLSLGNNKDKKIINLMGGGEDGQPINFDWTTNSGFTGSSLKFDGKKDYVKIPNIKGFKTIFMVIKSPISLVVQMIYDQRTNLDDFALYCESNEQLCYNSRNINGTYINGNTTINTTIYPHHLINKKHLITVTSNNSFPNDNAYIGRVNYKDGYFTNMELFKFLGYKEKLQQTEIQQVIQRYNLLEGIDKI